jgi:hypothetical protein
MMNNSELYGSMFQTIFGMFNEGPKVDQTFIGEGLQLIPDPEIKGNRDNYCYLYKDGVKVSDSLFRKGGVFTPFGKDKKYCTVIVYHDYKKDTMGNFCIIDSNGNIVMESENSFDSLYYLRGEIATMKGIYYNLKTGQPIVKGDSTVKSKYYLFVENTYNKDYEPGVYKIDYETGEFEIFR